MKPIGDLAAAARRKVDESVDTQRAFFEAESERIAACAQALATALGNGARLFTFGNGGSSCDAEHLAVEFSHPIFDKRAAFTSTTLGTSRALVSAIGNDEDFSLAYAKELRALARPGDVAIGFSTSGKSRNVVRALQTARELSLLTIAFTGRDGGTLHALCDHVFQVKSFSIHRIQETHVTLLHVLWDLVHLARGEEDVL